MRFAAKKVVKPWGHELWWAQTGAYLGKILVLRKGHRLSLQFHLRKRETLHVLRGILVLEHQGQRVRLTPGDSFDIAPRAVHRLAAPYGRVTLLEVSTPEAEDIVRLADDYGRAARDWAKLN